MFTSGLNRMFEMNFMTINFITDLVFQSRHDVLCCDRTERFTSLSGFKLKRHAQFIDSACEFLRFVQLAGFALGAFLFQILQLPQARPRHLMGLAVPPKIISGMTAAD